MKSELSKNNTAVLLPDADLSALADKIVQEVEEGKQALAISINETIKTTYWNIGRYIVKFEQEGNARAKYGTALFPTSPRYFAHELDAVTAAPT